MPIFLNTLLNIYLLVLVLQTATINFLRFSSCDLSLKCPSADRYKKNAANECNSSQIVLSRDGSHHLCSSCRKVVVPKLDARMTGEFCGIGTGYMFIPVDISIFSFIGNPNVSHNFTGWAEVTSDLFHATIIDFVPHEVLDWEKNHVFDLLNNQVLLCCFFETILSSHLFIDCGSATQVERGTCAKIVSEAWNE